MDTAPVLVPKHKTFVVDQLFIFLCVCVSQSVSAAHLSLNNVSLLVSLAPSPCFEHAILELKQRYA